MTEKKIWCWWWCQSCYTAGKVLQGLHLHTITQQNCFLKSWKIGFYRW